ncbi:unnamed protein product [Bursaphelenchus xylophilus]|uniref:(pine wood nematode) hypothetical protein n=1 Tax=Bursaphelenchus xylophilus TaxID=6326 RepID=A0A1I7S6P0_BURXY|nr:unnamed protein product [Bursaphelenchus xylophilus]CAG9120629.1 unnamed protein product [Bursaphelenchus xylophilus]
MHTTLSSIDEDEEYYTQTSTSAECKPKSESAPVRKLKDKIGSAYVDGCEDPENLKKVPYFQPVMSQLQHVDELDHNTVLTESVKYNGHVFKYIRKEKKGDAEYFCCMECRAVQRKANRNKERLKFCLRTSKVELDENGNKMFKPNPDDVEHACLKEENGMSILERYTVQAKRKVIDDMRNIPMTTEMAKKNVVQIIKSKFEPLELFSRAYGTLLKGRFSRTVAEHTKIKNGKDVSSVERNGVGNEQLPNKIIQYVQTDENKEPMVIMANCHTLRSLLECDYITCDGTFNYSPRGFSQVYNIRAVFTEFPTKQIAYCGAIFFLASKKESTYVKAFEELNKALKREFGRTLESKPVITDEELAAINGIKKVFPSLKHFLCYVHLCRNVLKHMRQVIPARYLELPQVKNWRYKIYGLAFVPKRVMKRAIHELAKEAELLPIPNANSEEIFDFTNYVATLSERITNTFYENTEVGRTGNNAEGFHSGLDRRFHNNNHPMVALAVSTFTDAIDADSANYLRFAEENENRPDGEPRIGLHKRQEKYAIKDLAIQKANLMLKEKEQSTTPPTIFEYLKYGQQVAFMCALDGRKIADEKKLKRKRKQAVQKRLACFEFLQADAEKKETDAPDAAPQSMPNQSLYSRFERENNKVTKPPFLSQPVPSTLEKKPNHKIPIEMEKSVATIA